jgi:HK97 family phage major capsid protein
VRAAEASSRRLGKAMRRAGGRAELGNSSGRIVRYLFSTPEVARDNHRILAWQLDDFKTNPIFCFAHQITEPPIGRVIEIEDRAGRLTGSVEYAERDVYPFADTIFQLVRGGFLNAVSVSWDPLKWHYAKDRSGGIDFELADLLEVSQVPVPALPTALATARSQGIDLAPFVEWTERALDKGDSGVPKKQLGELRRAAGVATVHQVRSPGQRWETAREIQRKTGRDPATHGFRSFGEQLVAIHNAAHWPDADRRLVRAPAGANEVNPTDGGFLVAPQFATELIGSIYEDAVLAPLTDRRPRGAPLADINVPAIDETSRADGSRHGGALAYWAAEADQVTARFPRFRNLKLSTKKLIAIVIGTNELLADVPLLEAHMRRVLTAELAFKVDAGILAGTGAGQLLGITNAPGTIKVAKETGQASGTITAGNVRAMWKRLPAPCRKRAVWIVNEDAEDQLEQLNGTGTDGSSIALYMPQGAGGNEYPLLKGRPVLVAEQCPQLGVQGDISVADLSQYLLIESPINVALSLHARFVEDEIIWRATLRLDGLPAWTSPITPYNGGATRSPFVTLGPR